jgi:hypothetical protein
MHVVLVAYLHHSCFSCLDTEYEQRCHHDRSRTSSASISYRQSMVASTIEVLGVGGALQGATSVEVVDVNPWLGDSAWGC